ncbi:MAG TPA: carboxymuconolactone decarboxylase family protein [Stellaceae bacterium]|jgi:AhpD family alkylhydroperoxidase|nr:carboxymuconolactone decarboxylase family protein [Stellaceae bacterium]
MSELLNYAKAAPEAVAALRGVETYVRQAVDPTLLELVKTRASQINGCAFCIDMHTKDARARGETEQRLYALAAWPETPFFSARERAALAWTEAVTKIADAPVPEPLYEELRRHFSEKEVVDLTMAVIAINGWNRLAATFRTPPGSYQPRK